MRRLCRSYSACSIAGIDASSARSCLLRNMNEATRTRLGSFVSQSVQHDRSLRLHSVEHHGHFIFYLHNTRQDNLSFPFNRFCPYETIEGGEEIVDSASEAIPSIMSPFYKCQVAYVGPLNTPGPFPLRNQLSNTAFSAPRERK